MSDKATQALVVGPLRLIGTVQEYAWGKVGQKSRIAPMAPGHRSDAPLAEYWIGTHPKGPSQIELTDGSTLPLDRAISQFGDSLIGEESCRQFGPVLPFMLKVLSVNPEFGLSIQVHPNESQARLLHAKAPQHYPDAQHKPEIGIPITPVSLLYGCKSIAGVLEVLKQLPELEHFLGSEVVAQLKAAQARGDAQGEVAAVKSLLSQCLTLGEERTSESVSRVAERLPLIPALSEESVSFDRLKRRYGSADPGLIAMLFMNLISVPPGKAIFIAPNIPHAYLSGDLVECMACSDNVIRAGLTPKFKDVETLLEVVDCSSALDGVRSPELDSDGFLSFGTPVREFHVRMLDKAASGAMIRSGDGPGVVLCIGKEIAVRGLVTGKTVRLSDGGAAFIPPHSGDYQVEVMDAVLFYVIPNLI